MEDINDPVGQFVQNHVVYSPGTTMSITKLYNLFLSYMEEDSEYWTIQKFGKDVRPYISNLLGKHFSKIFVRRAKGRMVLNIEVKKEKE